MTLFEPWDVECLHWGSTVRVVISPVAKAEAAIVLRG